MFFDMSGFSPISFIYITCRLLYCNFKLKLFCLPDKAQKAAALFNYRRVSAQGYQDLLKFIILALIFAIIIILAFKKNKFENIGNMTMFKWTEVLLKIYVSIYFWSSYNMLIINVEKLYLFLYIRDYHHFFEVFFQCNW